MKAQKFIPLLVVAAGLLAYHNSFTGGFFLDDFGSIPENPTIRHLWPIWQCLTPPHRGGLTVEGRPVVNLSLAINYALGGFDVWGYHALNLTVHILAGLTLLGIVRRTLLQPALRERFGAAAIELALAIAILWTVHPLQTESVTYIIQRAESLMGLFYLLTLYCFIRGVDSAVGTRCSASESLVGMRSTASVAELELGPTKGVAAQEHSPTGSAALPSTLWFALSVAACALGMVSKEVMVSAPLMVLLYDRAFLSTSFREAWQRRWRLYVALASTWILLGFVLASGQLPATLMNAQHLGLRWWEYLATQPGVILHYLRLCVWPSPLRLDPAWPIARTWMSILPPAAVVLILLAAAAWGWRRNTVWGFVGAWFFLILAPTSSFIPLRDPFYEHRMYLSLAAVVSLAVTGLYSRLGLCSLVVFVVAAIGLGFLTWRRNQHYHRDPHYTLGVALATVGRIQEAIGQYEQVLRIAPDDAEAHYNLGRALRQAGQLQEAVDHWEQALRIAPGFAEGQNDLGLALVELGRVPEAIGHYEQALRLKPDYPEAHNNLGLALVRSGRAPEAIGHWKQALQIKPDYAEAHNNLGLALLELGKVQAAIEHWQQALRIKPDSADAHNNLGGALLRLGRILEAVDHWEQALRIKPDHPEAHYNLGVALEQAGRVQEAIGHYEQALRIRPNYAKAQDALARLRTVQ